MAMAMSGQALRIGDAEGEPSNLSHQNAITD